MSTNRAAIRSLIQEYEPAGFPAYRTEQVMTSLEPFFAKADSGSYTLAGKGDLPDFMILLALSQASGEPILVSGAKVEYLSFGELASKAADRPNADENRTVWDKAISAANPRLRSLIGRSYNGRLDAYLGSVMRKRIDDILWPALGEPLWHSFEGNRWDGASQMFRMEVRATILEAIEFYVGFCVAGDEAGMAALSGIIGALPSTVVLGCREGTADTFITLVD